ncbi:hypothetical protein L0B53_06195 [Vibrio sp. SS-MA-C1-2]|uniref:hypothetical protein n=1 Tax=Vibrio sp. SS-MA-C1-2 TaxID=2908646 RepID=UPI001F2AA060|nr:hypothetical protein [Vibrio sp. SS-MA-C1-2]UJF19165.1 hypothetical protein L0B53_06195 [Vibrio sp. SS-MA-C1-2]
MRSFEEQLEQMTLKAWNIMRELEKNPKKEYKKKSSSSTQEGINKSSQLHTASE